MNIFLYFSHLYYFVSYLRLSLSLSWHLVDVLSPQTSSQRTEKEKKWHFHILFCCWTSKKYFYACVYFHCPFYGKSLCETLKSIHEMRSWKLNAQTGVKEMIITHFCKTNFYHHYFPGEAAIRRELLYHLPQIQPVCTF